MTDLTPTGDDINKAFATGSYRDASEDELEGYLRALGTEGIKNPYVQHRSLVRAITINNVQMARVIRTLEGTIKQLNDENAKSQKLVMVLAIASLVGTVVQVVVSFLR